MLMMTTSVYLPTKGAYIMEAVQSPDQHIHTCMHVRSAAQHSRGMERDGAGTWYGAGGQRGDG